MHKMIKVILLTLPISGCATSSPSPDPMARKVAALVDRATSPRMEMEAFEQLESLGSDAAPYIVHHLGDMRPLPIKQIELANGSSGAFEGIRHYAPEVVHDALSAILNQVTGMSFEFVYNGATSETREMDRARWQAWCVRAYPAKALVCSGG
ncbi:MULTISPECIES: hypothetical protein [unclassified Rhodanobacter]|uniref:hypothetical protein n=1 Tax=unclassified Rhodanobacter TaxID=2621553 RepID=UPI001BDF4141|nr:MULTISPECIES: hypothetical protein [unclassified Rhodanobacter]MBT2144416.1 hypothetical protein [Rhodanobacter sp. LX-99]MBT2149917.1 hypothetical protein [Rhodanobacter sp. LX-100]